MSERGARIPDGGRERERGPREVVLATRGSTLARRQTGTVEAALADRRYEVEVLEVETEGDRLSEELIRDLGTTGAFVHSLDERVLDGEADLAVHSLKDVPTEAREGLVVAAVPERATPGDALVTPDGTPLEELPRGATVGTSSLRRRAELLSARPDLKIAPLRGNVDTRVEKLLAPGLQAEHERRLAAEEDPEDDEDADDENADGEDADGEDVTFDRSADEWFDDLAEIERRALGREVETAYDAVVLAIAGLERSGLAGQVPYRELPPSEFVPAPGQGALAVVGRDDELTDRVRQVLDDPRSRLECAVERAVLAGVGGGCVAPVGAFARLKGDVVHVETRVLSTDGEEEVAAGRDLPVADAVPAARELAASLRDRGAAELVDAAHEESERGDGAGSENAPTGNGP